MTELEGSTRCYLKYGHVYTPLNYDGSAWQDMSLIDTFPISDRIRGFYPLLSKAEYGHVIIYPPLNYDGSAWQTFQWTFPALSEVHSTSLYGVTVH